MIEYSDFEKIVLDKLGRDIRIDVNEDQHDAITAPPDTSLFVVAGPGSGKTTVMVLKILKFILVDGIKPSSILATTFTRKAASQLKSRTVEWGNELKSTLMENPKHSSIKVLLKKLDFRRIVTGTLDSIAEDILKSSDHGPSPAIIEDLVSNALMIKVGLMDHDRQKDKDLQGFLNQIRGARTRLNVSIMSQILLEIKDRIYHDRIDFEKFIGDYEHPGAKPAYDAISDYINDLKNRNLLDFSMLEDEFLRKLQTDKLKSLKNIRIVLVDEYQDTNLLQETIYLKIAETAVKNNGSIIVVGDDDQSLYRFRGATVDLFTDFGNRLNSQLGITSLFVNLSKNYRSTEHIVDFCNEFIQIDKEFQNARAAGKRLISPRLENPHNVPVLGMFREDINTLAADLAEFIREISHGEGITLKYKNNAFKIKINEREGSHSDIAFLCSSPLELDFKGNSRLPILLKDELNKINPQIPVFNPRGQSLGRIPVIETLCGMLLECIDPEGEIQDNIGRLPRNAVSRFKIWRSKALTYIDTKEDECKEIHAFLDTWRSYFQINEQDKVEVPLVDLIYKIVKWIPEILDEEGLVYLEIIIKTITQTSLFSDFKSNIILNGRNRYLDQNSVTEVLWNIFVPIALGAINLDLDILENLPKNGINIMSIHQSKGLEFPIVIVDVGSDFKMNYANHAFKRFPGTPGKSCTLEDNMRKFSKLGKPMRNALDRAFDDIIRQYFVAFSRPQGLLLLVGLNSLKDGYFFNNAVRYVPNVATGWDRDGKWHWEGLNNLFHI
jgi:DNA helicase II / ATP-dependent DNA helicase PcrA